MKKATFRILSFAFLLIGAFSLTVSAQTSNFMSVDEVRPGMKGFGKTVFQGTKIEQFDVELLGVLKNFAPKQDMVLARLSGGPLARTGVIAGMSGSPVYIDGKLLGAVAFSFPFATEPIAGIQPIQQMLGLLDQKNVSPPRQIAQISGQEPGPAAILLSESPTAFIYNQFQKIAEGTPLHQLLLPQSLSSGSPLGSVPSAASLTRIQTPLFVSGATPAALQQFAPFFSTFGFSPVQGGGGGSAQNLTGGTPSKIEPGSSINVELIRGDISWSANGTVTYVDGNKVYAFGHPNLTAGPTDVPMSAGYVISLLPNLQNSFKLAVPLDVVGAFQQDRSTGIAGTLGSTSRMIPVHLTLRSSLNTVKYNFEVAADRFLTPPLMNFIVFNAITSSERALGEMTVSVSGQIHLKNHEPVNIGNVFSSDMNGPAMASIAAVSPLQYLLMAGYDGVVIDDINLDITSMDRKTNAQLERISVNKAEVAPGETITLTAYLRATSGDTVIEQYPVEIPAGLSAGPVQLVVGDGTTVTNIDIRRGPSGVPAGIKQVINELNKLRKNDRLYIKVVSFAPGVVIGGEEFPSLPPSMAAVINSDRSSSRSLSGLPNSTVREYELPQSKYVIQGQRALNLTVKPIG